MDINNFLESLTHRGVKLRIEDKSIKYMAPKGALGIDDIKYLKEHKKEIMNLICEDLYHDEFDLTDVQSAYLIGRENIYKYGDVACHLYLEISYPRLDARLVNDIWSKMIEKHDMLRVCFTPDKKQKIISSIESFNVEINEFTDEKFDSGINNIRANMENNIFSQNKAPLFEVKLSNGINKTILHLSIDFLIADWISIIFLISEFEKAYFEKQFDAEKPIYTFREYVKEEKIKKESAKYGAHKSYWEDRIGSLPEAPSLPMNRNVDTNIKNEFSRMSMELNEEQWERIKVVAKEHRLTPTTIVLTCYSLVIAKWATNNHFCLNLTTLSRDEKYRKHFLVGDFTKTTLLEVKIDEKTSFLENARKMQKQLILDLEHNMFNGIEVIREIAKKNGYEKSLMPIVFTSAIGTYDDNKIREIKGNFEYGLSQTPQVFIDCQAMDINGKLKLNWDYRKDIIRNDVIVDMFNTLEILLKKIGYTNINHVNTSIVELPKWQADVFEESNKTFKKIEPKLLYDDSLEMYKIEPNRNILFHGERVMNYRELIQESVKLSKNLIERGLKPGDRVGIYFPKGIEQIISVYGILMAGCTYVPLDVNMPIERINNINKRANFAMIISELQLDIDIPILLLKNLIDYEDLDFEPVRVSVDDTAYIIFTSGTTGEPKGVEISHKAAWNTIKDVNERIDCNKEDVFLGVSRLCFDLSVYDIFGALSVGAKLILPRQNSLTNPNDWIYLIKKHKVTIWNSVPALMELMTNILEDKNYKIYTIRKILLSGDWIPLKLPCKIQYFLCDASLYSLGGATEASIWSNIYKVEKIDKEYDSIPYGKPLSNQKFKILNENLNSVPIWVKGDLYIKGTGLAKGYVNDYEITSKSFITDPEDGHVMYRTGDKAMYHPDGIIEFMGREDTQVKINGYRIELNEIENAINKIDEVESSIVGVNNEKSIVALINTKYKNNENKIIDFGEYANYFENVDVDVFESYFKNIDIACVGAIKHVLRNLDTSKLKKEYEWIINRWKIYIEKNGEGFDELEISESIKILDSIYGIFPNTKVFINYIKDSINNLFDVCYGNIEPHKILMPNNNIELLKEFYNKNILFDDLNFVASKIVNQYIANKRDTSVKILEIGAGTGGSTDKILKEIDMYSYEYYFTDKSKMFINEAKRKYRDHNFVYLEYDLNDNNIDEYFLSNSIDIIIASGVFENCKDINKSLKSVMNIIKPEGLFLWMDPTKDLSWILVSQLFMMTEPKDGIRIEKNFFDVDDWEKIFEPYCVSNIYKYPDKKIMEAIGTALFACIAKRNKQYVDLESIKEKIKKILPEYMIPNYIEIVDNFELTSNGKIDRKSLLKYPKKQISSMKLECNENSKLNIISDDIILIWKDVLNTDVIGINDNLYDFGADSLLIAQGVVKICDYIDKLNSNKKSGFDEVLRFVLEYPRISDISNFIKNKVISYTPIVEEIEKIWCDLLCVNEIDYNKNMYSYGADSLILAQGISKTIEIHNRYYNNNKLKFEELLNKLIQNPSFSTIVSYFNGKLALDEKTSVEEEIISEWKTLLNVDEIDINKNIYEYGADSLIIAQGVARSCNILKEDVYFDEMLRNILNKPFISTVLSKFEKNDDFTNVFEIDSCIDLKFINENLDSNTVYIFFHSSMGCIDEYKMFTEYLKTHIKDAIAVFKIKDSKIYKNINENNFIRILSERYSNMIMKLPYEKIILIGHSFGGMIAYEVGATLQLYGKNISKMYLIEAYPIHWNFENQVLIEMIFQHAIGVDLSSINIKNIPYNILENFISNCVDKNLKEDNSIYEDDSIIEEFEDVISTMKKINRVNINERFKVYSEKLFGTDNIDLIKEMFHEFCYGYRALNYNIQNYIGNIVYFKSYNKEKSGGINHQGIKLLNDSIIGDIEYIDIDSDHFTIINDKNNIEKIISYLKE